MSNESKFRHVGVCKKEEEKQSIGATIGVDFGGLSGSVLHVQHEVYFEIQKRLIDFFHSVDMIGVVPVYHVEPDEDFNLTETIQKFMRDNFYVWKG